jgi:hypothetical protein
LLELQEVDIRWHMHGYTGDAEQYYELRPDCIDELKAIEHG